MPLADVASPNIWGLNTPLGPRSTFAVAPGYDDVRHGEDADTSMSSTMGAAFRQGNFGISTFARKDLAIDPYEKEEGFDLPGYVKSNKLEDHWGSFTDVFNTRAADARKRQIDMEADDKRTLGAAPWYKSLPAQLVAGGLDLPSLLPGGAFYRGATGGISIGRSAFNVSRAAALATTAQELGLHATQETRTVGESLENIGASTFLGGLLGAGGAALVSRGEWRAGIAALNRELRGEKPPGITEGGRLVPEGGLRGMPAEHFGPVGEEAARITAAEEGARLNLKPEQAEALRNAGVPIDDQGLVSPLDHEAILAERDRRGSSPEATEGAAPQPAGAAANVPATTEANAIAGRAAGAIAAVSKPLNPFLRLFQSPSAAVREIAGKLVEGSVYLKKNFAGVASEPAVETLMKEWNGGLVTALKATDAAFLEHRKSGGTLSREQFREAVGRAMRRGDESLDPHVAKVAAAWRKAVVEPLKDAAIAQGLLPKDVSVTTAPSYFSRMWNRQRLIAQEGSFKSTVRDFYNQAIGREYQEHQGNVNARIARLEQEIQDITLSPQERAGRLDELETAISEHEAANPEHMETADRLSERYGDMRRAREAAEAAHEAGDRDIEARHRAAYEAAKSHIGLIRESGGPDLEKFIAERSNLLTRRRNVDLGAAGLAARRSDIMETLADIEEANQRSLGRLVKKGQKLERELDKLEPEVLAERISDLKNQFAEIARRSEAAADRAAKAIEKIKADAEKAREKAAKEAEKAAKGEAEGGAAPAAPVPEPPPLPPLELPLAGSHVAPELPIAPAAVSHETLAPARVDESAIVNPIDRNATPEEKVRQLQALTAENKPLVDDFIRKIDQEFGTESKSNEKAGENIISKGSRPSILARKPWHAIEHVRDSFRFKTVLDDIRQLPDIIDRIKEAGFEIVKRDTAKVEHPLEWGWRIASFDLRMPNGQLVEYYLPIRELENAKGEGHKIFEKWRNEDEASLTPTQVRERATDMERSRKLYQDAWDAALARSGATASDVRATLSKASTAERSDTGLNSSAKSPTVSDIDFQTPPTRMAENLPPSESARENTNTTEESSRSTYAPTGQEAGSEVIGPSTTDIGTPADAVKKAAEAKPISSPIANGVAMFSPADLKVDARRFQFKDGGDEAGVTDRLKGVKKWDPIKAGMVLVWQDKAGNNFITDGHQRHGLASRIAAEDPAQNPQLLARVLREADGVTDADARTIAALKNIAEGTGTAVDAAKVLRENPGKAGELPPRSELFRQAQGLTNLSDDAFRMVINDVVPANYGAIVGRLVPADPQMQSALLGLLAKTEPANATQAESIIRQGIEAGTAKKAEGAQGGLFGDEDVAESLYLDRAKVLDRALKSIKQDKKIFSVLTKEQSSIEAAGNKLAAGVNEKRAAADAQALQILQTLASRKGPVSDALGRAAERARADGKYPAAVSDFVAAIRDLLDRHDLARLADGVERGPTHVGDENRTGVIDRAPELATPEAEAKAGAEAKDVIDQGKELFQRGEPRGSAPRMVSSKEMQTAVLRNEWARNGRDLDFDDILQTDAGNRAWEREVDAWNERHGTKLDADEIFKNDAFRKSFEEKYLAGKKAPFPGVKEANEFFENEGRYDQGAYLPGEEPTNEMFRLGQAERPGVGPGEREFRIAKDVTGHYKPTELYTAKEAEIARAVGDVFDKMFPDAQHAGFTNIYWSGRGAPQNVHGVFMQTPHPDYPSFIGWTLNSPNVIDTARHEGLHFLRRMNYLRDDEWDVLARAAEENGWRTPEIERRYADFSEETRTEEAIADAFGKYRNGQLGLDGPARAIFDKIKELMGRVAGALRRVLGREPTFEDIFRRIESGEIGGRAPGEGETGGALQGGDLFSPTEKTVAGQQMILPGGERSAVQLAAQRESAGRGKMQPKVAQKEAGGLFAPKEPEQGSLFQLADHDLTPEQQAAITSRLEKEAAAHRARAKRMNSVAERLEMAERFDRDGALAELKNGIDKAVAETSSTSLGRGERAQRLQERLATLDPKRVADRVKIINQMKAEIERSFHDRWETKNLGQGVGLDREEPPDFTDQASDIADHVYNTLTGRTEADTRPEFMTVGTRGPMKDRTFNIPDAHIEDFLEHDVERVMRRYSRVMGADVEMARKFGSVDMKDQFDQIVRNYDQLRRGVTDEAQLTRLGKQEQSDKDDLEAMRDLLRGTRAESASPFDRNYAKVARIANHFNYMRSMGEVVLASLTDVIRPAMVHGLLPYMRTIGQLATNLEGVRMSLAEAKLAGNIAEKYTHSRLATLADLHDPYSARGPVEAFMEKMSDVSSKWNGIRLWTDWMKGIAATMTQNRILEGAVNFARTEDRPYLAFLGVDEGMAQRIAAQFAQHGQDVEGVRVAGTEKWTDEVARRTYRAAMNKDIDSIIIQTGKADVPLFVHTPTGKMLLQFQSFNLASHQRILLRGLQEGQARFLGGMVAMTSMGMFMTWLKALSGNRTERLEDITKNPGWWIGEGVDRSGVFAVPLEIANRFEKLTGFNPIKTPMKLGDQGAAESQKNQNRNQFGSMLGPTFGLGEDLATVAGTPRSLYEGKDISKGQKGAMERLMPFNSYAGVRQMMRYVVNPPH